MWLRNGVVLSLTLLGAGLLVAAAAHDGNASAALVAGAAGCWVLARVYAEVTRR